MGIFDIDYSNFRYADSSCYGCFGVWGRFTDHNVVPSPGEYNDSLDWIYPETLVPADSFKYGPAGWNIPPDSADYLWLKLKTPEYYSQDTLRAKILLKGVIHTP